MMTTFVSLFKRSRRVHSLRILSFLTLFLAVLLGSQVWLVGHARLVEADLMLGGNSTFTGARTIHAFGEAVPGLSEDELEEFEIGDEHFGANFLSQSTEALSGLGPLFDNPSCEGCHFGDGKGRPALGLSRNEMVIRLSQKQGNESIPFPEIGNQLAAHALYGSSPEAAATLAWEEVSGTYADGSSYSLRQPQLAVTLPNGDPLPPNTLMSLRVAPKAVGTGLLDAIPQDTLLALADPEDQNGDGISGRPNLVLNLDTDREEVGRFGWKANAPTLHQQVAEAYFNDMGVSNPLIPDEDGSTDIDQMTLDQTYFYTAALAVAKADQRLLTDPTLQKGQSLFTNSCISCHVATLKTGSYPIQALANQTLHPYTDLLLHDMGEGLADNRPDHQADGREWRTAPLWNTGLATQLNPYAGYLHDGRARTVAEAILWHGGEAAKAAETFQAMSAEDRNALVKFVEAL